MARTLYLHIGMHKTGTTSLQRALAANKAALAAQGFAYVTGFNDNNLHEFVGKREEEVLADSGFHLKKREEFIKVLTAPTETKIIGSSESFSYFFRRVAIQNLEKLLRPHFKDIRIICYLRRQDQLAISHHQEGAKPQDKPAAKIYGHSPTALPQHTEMSPLYLDYATRIGHWAVVFGDAAITLRIFDRSLMKDGDSITDFLEVVGLDRSAFEPTENLNVSMGMARTKLGHILNELVDHQQTKVRILANLPDEGKLLPRREDAVKYVAQFAEGNRALNARFNITSQPTLFSDDFSTYPEAGNELWTEATADSALRGMAKVVNTLTQGQLPLTVQDLLDGARAVSGKAPETAMKFLKAALILRPDGEVVKKRIAALKERLSDLRKARGGPETPDGADQPSPKRPMKAKTGARRRAGGKAKSQNSPASPATPDSAT